MTSPAAPRPEPSHTGQWLRSQRQARSWSVPEMRRRLRDAAATTGDTLPGNECLGVMIRRWEHDHGGISERYRLHYSRALGIPPEDFGTAPPPPAALRDILTRAAATAPDPPPLGEHERAELTRLRYQHAQLTTRHRKLKRDLATWLLRTIDEDADPETPDSRPPRNHRA